MSSCFLYPSHRPPCPCPRVPSRIPARGTPGGYPADSYPVSGYSGWLREKHPREDELAHRWFALPPGTNLPLSNGGSCLLIFAGRTGSAAGPDVHDAVLRFADQEEAISSVGDIEFHVYASDWYTHGHQRDARYNNVILHVVLVCDIDRAIVRQDGGTIPMCSLNDIAPVSPLSAFNGTGERIWPCQQLASATSEQERGRLLLQAGLLRFEEKAHAFVEELHSIYSASISSSFSAYDTCLIPSIAEGMGYGRNRAFFRAVGEYLLGLSKTVPEPLGHTFEPPSLDASRLLALRALIAQWRVTGLWETVKKGLLAVDTPTSSEVLRSLFGSTDIGMARADILICNCILPFALAIALVENNALLAERATALYQTYPSLSSNRITRAMSRQLLLAQEPEGACRQQGLHYIYRQTCREKRCEMCRMGRRGI